MTRAATPLLCKPPVITVPRSLYVADQYAVYRWRGGNTWTQVLTTNQTINRILSTPENTLLLCGAFTTVNGVSVPYLAEWAGGNIIQPYHGISPGGEVSGAFFYGATGVLNVLRPNGAASIVRQYSAEGGLNWSVNPSGLRPYGGVHCTVKNEVWFSTSNTMYFLNGSTGATINWINSTGESYGGMMIGTTAYLVGMFNRLNNGPYLRYACYAPSNRVTPYNEYTMSAVNGSFNSGIYQACAGAGGIWYGAGGLTTGYSRISATSATYNVSLSVRGGIGYDPDAGALLTKVGTVISQVSGTTVTSRGLTINSGDQIGSMAWVAALA